MKQLLLLSMLMMAVGLMSAQNRWAFGLDVEAGLSGQRDTEESYSPNPQFGDYAYSNIDRRRPGVSAGVWTEYLFSHRFGLRMGANFARKQSFSETENINYGTSRNMTYYSRTRTEVNQNQLRIPLEGKLYFGRSDRSWRAFASLGVQAGYIFGQTNSRDVLSGGSTQVETYESTTVQETDFRNQDYPLNRWQGAVIGGFGIMTSNFTLSLQRTWGLSGGQPYGHDYYCYCGVGLIDDYYPYGGVSGNVQQIKMTSLRIAYRLF